MSSNSSPTLQTLVDLCHHRWVIPLVAAIGRRGERFAVLGRRLAVAPQTLRRALDAAAARGLVEENPGYGHPLRPEYRLTAAGLRIEGSCRNLVDILDEPAAKLAGRKWSLPVLAAVEGGSERFSAIQSALPGATARALSMALDDLVQGGWVERELVDGRPPGAIYSVTPGAGSLARRVRKLAARSASACRVARRPAGPGD